MCDIFHCLVNIHARVFIECLWYLANYSAHEMRDRGKRLKIHVGDENFCASVRTNLFCSTAYFTKIRLDPGSYYR